MNHPFQVNRVDISKFRVFNRLGDKLRMFLVVKSLNQSERRKNILSSKKRGIYGRTTNREIAEGLLAEVKLNSNRLEIVRTVPFKEPRDIVRFDDHFILSEISTLQVIDKYGNVKKSIKHPYFSFLHTVSLSPDKKSVLVVSAGYDALIEVDILTGKEQWSWFAWEHGFTPTRDGWFLTRDVSFAKQLIKDGKKVKIINTSEYGEFGIATAFRSAHPNSACYNIYKSKQSSILSTIGHQWSLYEIDKDRKHASRRLSNFGQMPHGIMPHQKGWLVTDTTKGNACLLDVDYENIELHEFSHLPWKHELAGENEWIQQVIPITKYSYIAIDANRGIIIYDVRKKLVTCYKPDPEWCIQDLLLLEEI